MIALLPVQLTREDAQEVLHKLRVVSETEDLMEGYKVTPEQMAELLAVIPQAGGRWACPHQHWCMVCAEMADHCEVLRDIAADARSGGRPGEALRISKQVKRLSGFFPKPYTREELESSEGYAGTASERLARESGLTSYLTRAVSEGELFSTDGGKTWQPIKPAKK